MFASAIYSQEDKFVLEILAPHSLMVRRECEEEQTDLNNGGAVDTEYREI